MPSGNFTTLDVSSIKVPDNRQRVVPPSHITRLQDSINRLGLINPITVTRDHELVAGFCRLTAVRNLGHTHILVQYEKEIDEFTRYCIELEENTKREDLHWKDQNRAVAGYHELRKLHDPDWTQEQTAAALGLERSSVTKHVMVAEEIKLEPEGEVAKADTFVTAINRRQRLNERRRADDLLGESFTNTHSPVIVTADFHAWAPAYRGSKFNLIHCDFPYGINSHQNEGQNSALDVEYTDTPEAYWALVKTLSDHLDAFCAPSAHMLFWFSPTVYCQTWAALQQLDGFEFDEHPLIWQRGENEGIAPNPAQRPRRIYEMAFFGWRGDRKIVRTKANSVVAPTERQWHPHAKSQAALEHFFEMVVDEQTAIFDPTCGSGAALRAAKSLGAKRYLGLEISEEYAKDARRAWVV